MDQLAGVILFEAWVRSVFDHPVTDPAWHWTGAATPGYQPPEMTVDYMTRIFEGSSEILKPYSNAQVNQALWFLMSPDCSDYAFAVLEPSVAWPHRQRCLRSMYRLFEQCFASRCTPGQLSHLRGQDQPEGNPLNSVCYMWWDLFPFRGSPQKPECLEAGQEGLAILQSILDLDVPACQESALHGLGHWQHQYPQEVSAIITRFLDKHPDLAPALQEYACCARQGCIL